MRQCGSISNLSGRFDFVNKKQRLLNIECNLQSVRMKDSIQKILLAADDDIQCEWHSEFDRDRELDRVRAIQPMIEKTLSCDLDLDDSIQDASYFASLALWKYIPPDPNLYTASGVKRAGTNYAVIDISFSCFGNLVTIGSAFDSNEQFSHEKIVSVAKVLNENGFVYIPEKYLFEKYSGNNPHFSDSTWGERYFSYL